jgi:hypothetical protein
MMDRRALVAGTLALLAAPLVAEAQEGEKIPRIGFLRSGSPPDPFVEAFRQGLRELGYVEGRCPPGGNLGACCVISVAEPTSRTAKPSARIQACQAYRDRRPAR